MPLTAAEVHEYCDYLENQNDHMEMRNVAKERHMLHSMLKVPDLPDHMTRGVGTAEPTPMMIWLANNILADIAPYPIMPIVTPTPNDTVPLQEMGDKLERWAAIFRASVDPGGARTREVEWHQLLSPYAVMVLRCGAPGEDLPWSVETPDPLTCFFPVEGGPMRPEVFSRRYKQMIRKAEKQYSGRKNYEDKRWQNRDEALSWKDGHWTWTKIGDDREHDTTMLSKGSGPFEECEFFELHEGGMIYHLAMNKGGKDGEIVWQGKSLTGGVSAVVIPGNVSPLREAAERYQPVLWPAYQMVHLINRVRAKRATRSENLKPDVLVEETAETLRAQSLTGNNLAMGQNAALEAGGPNMISVRGKPTLWSVQEDPDLDKQEQSYWRELDRYIESMTEVSDPEVIKETTANAFLTNLESRKRQRAPMLNSLAWGWNEIIKMAIYSIGEYDRDFELYATADNEHESVKRGEGASIGKADLDFEYAIQVQIKSTTEAESRSRVQDWAYRKGLGLSTQFEGLTAAAYQDESEQAEKLAVDLGRQMVTEWNKQMVTQVVAERIRLRSGILVPMGAAPPAPAGDNGAPPSGMAPMRPAAIPGPVGTS